MLRLGQVALRGRRQESSSEKWLNWNKLPFLIGLSENVIASLGVCAPTSPPVLCAANDVRITHRSSSTSIVRKSAIPRRHFHRMAHRDRNLNLLSEPPSSHEYFDDWSPPAAFGPGNCHLPWTRVTAWRVSTTSLNLRKITSIRSVSADARLICEARMGAPHS